MEEIYGIRDKEDFIASNIYFPFLRIGVASSTSSESRSELEPVISWGSSPSINAGK